jgi:hypothetical protein
MWSSGKLLEVDKAVNGVLLEIRELDQRGEAQPSNKSPTLLIKAFLQFMTVTCALWTEIASHISSKADSCMHSLALRFHSPKHSCCVTFCAFAQNHVARTAYPAIVSVYEGLRMVRKPLVLTKGACGHQVIPKLQFKSQTIARGHKTMITSPCRFTNSFLWY